MITDNSWGSFPLTDITAFRGVIDAVPHPIFVKDEQTRFVIMNETMCQLMNRPFEELIGKTDYDFFPKEQADVFRGNDLRVLQTGEVNENEELFSDGEGSLRTIVTRKKRLTLSDGGRLLVGCITDISDFRRAEALIRHHAEHDALTSLPNRRVLSDKIKEAVARATRSGAVYSILLVDLDRFKPVNDLYGHTVGDAVLCEIAARLQRVVRTGDTVTRLGGDEFAIISETNPALDLPAEAAASLAGRVVSAAKQPITIGDAVIEVGASVGIAQCPADGTNDDTLLHCADVAMYRAKRGGRGTFHFFEERMDAEVRDQAALEVDLRRAVASREIVPYYQPLIALAEERLIGFEILARWPHPQRGFIEPDLFVPIAEKLGLISELTFTLLRVACRDAKTWPGDPVLCLNLSPIQLNDNLLAVKILEVLTETSFPPRRLEIEITESALVNDLRAAKAALTSFQNLGIKVSLDDFGTGYASLYHLRELQFDKIKVDRSFIQSLRRDPASERIVHAILGLAKSLGLPAVAEGIEDEAARRLAIDSGCEIGQGFFFGKALPASAIPGVIEAHGETLRARRAG